MIRPEELIGQKRFGGYAIRGYRGNVCAGWVFAAEHVAMPTDFGGGVTSAKVMLEVNPGGAAYNPQEIHDYRSLQPHPHLLRCLDAGVSREADLPGASYLVTEAWRDTLADVLARRTTLDSGEVLPLTKTVAAALARYHSENRVHGDVRAERICRVDGQWKLAPVFRSRAKEGGRHTVHVNGGPSHCRSSEGERPAGKATSAHVPACTSADDVFSLGLTILHCLVQGSPGIDKTGHPRSWSQAEIDKALRDLPELWRYWLGRCLAAEPGQRCSASELALIGADIPVPVAAVSVDRNADQYRLQWQAADRGNVRVYRWSRGRCPAQGEVWLITELERIGDSVPLSTPTSANIQLQPGAACQVIVVTVLGDAAVVGDSITLTWAADVERLKLTVEGRAIAATWDWPVGAHVARVAIRAGAFPAGPNDPQARTERCFRAGYMAEGRFVIPIDPKPGVLHVAVYAIYRHEHGWECACGRTHGARAVISFTPDVRLHYWIEKVPLLARILLKAGRCRLSMRVDQTATLPELTLVAGESLSPFEMGNGLPVLQVPSQQYEEGVVVRKDFQPPKGLNIENTRLLVQGESNDRLRLIPERCRAGDTGT